MQLFDSVSDSESLPQPVESSETSLMKNPKTTRPKLSIIWVKESDNVRQCLVARWVTQD